MNTKKRLLTIVAAAALAVALGSTSARAAGAMHNPNKPLDVDANALVQPQDALLVINLLIRSSATQPAMTPLEFSALTAPPAAYFYDTSNDANISPIDALLVINHLILAPEPSSLVLGGFALAGLAVWARRRRKIAA